MLSAAAINAFTASNCTASCCCDDQCGHRNYFVAKTFCGVARVYPTFRTSHGSIIFLYGGALTSVALGNSPGYCIYPEASIPYDRATTPADDQDDGLALLHKANHAPFPPPPPFRDFFARPNSNPTE